MATESKTVTIVPLTGANFPTRKVQCQMALVCDGLWEIVARTETAPAATETAEVRSKFQARRDRALATIVLVIDPALLYLIGDLDDLIAVWMTLF